MQQIKCFEVSGHTDTTEGRGPMKAVARFSNYDAAVNYVKSPAYYKKWCVMGCSSSYDINYIQEATLTILESCHEVEEMEKVAIRDRALS